MGADELLALVRVTARITAVCFSSALILHARTRVFRALLLTCAVVHTIHFGFVAAYSRAVNFENIVERGGWLQVLVVAAIFYVGLLYAIAGASRRLTDPMRRWRAGEVVGLLAIAFFFSVSYYGRAYRTWMYFGLEVLVIVAAVAFLGARLAAWRAAQRASPAAT